MNFRYDFGDKLETANFAKQAKHYCSTFHSNEWNFNFWHFKLITGISKGVSTKFLVTVQIFDLTRDSNGEIINVVPIKVSQDVRFCSFPILENFFEKQFPQQIEASYWFDTLDEAISSTIDILKILSKINKLRAFL